MGPLVRLPRDNSHNQPNFMRQLEKQRAGAHSSGAGEVSLAGVAPAIDNAIFDAVGVRLRSLPVA
jgi:CO/xanthine dehydrogenase Mo-binding subunit